MLHDVGKRPYSLVLYSHAGVRYQWCHSQTQIALMEFGQIFQLCSCWYSLSARHLSSGLHNVRGISPCWTVISTSAASFVLVEWHQWILLTMSTLKMARHATLCTQVQVSEYNLHVVLVQEMVPLPNRKAKQAGSSGAKIPVSCPELEGCSRRLTVLPPPHAKIIRHRRERGSERRERESLKYAFLPHPSGISLVQSGGAGTSASLDHSERCDKCSGLGTTACSDCGGRGQLLSYIELQVVWKNNVFEYLADQRTGFPTELFKEVSGQKLFVDEQYMVYPVTGFPEGSINQASRNAIEQHKTQFGSTARILRERQTIELLFLTRVEYEWHRKSYSYFVYGNEHKVYAENYPRKAPNAINLKAVQNNSILDFLQQDKKREEVVGGLLVEDAVIESPAQLH
ncbi:hypothetical protein EYD10_04553 [Varanus komodoensis]|nr:hypothetical protein EYD10_04553 [Varanus komodoensis]